MPLGYGSSATFTTADPTAGRQYTRLRGPLLVGAEAKSDLAGASPGASVSPPHIMNVSTFKADLYVSGGTMNLVSSGTTTNVFGFPYVPISTYQMSASSGAFGPTPTPLVLGGAAIVWDSVTTRLCVYSTVAGEWRSVGFSCS